VAREISNPMLFGAENTCHHRMVRATIRQEQIADLPM
jgi:hypothetical protein